MKNIKAVAELMKVIAFMGGLILCMCETNDITQQIYVLLAGAALMIIPVLATLLRDWRATWRMN